MLLQMLFLVVITIFVGQAADTVTLNAVGLGVSVINVFGTSLCQGVSTAIDTLGAQAYGSQSKAMVGVRTLAREAAGALRLPSPHLFAARRAPPSLPPGRSAW